MKTEFWKKNKNRLLFIAAATAVICLVTMLFYSPGMISAPFGTVISILTPFLVGLVIAYLLLPMTLIFERKLRKIGGKKAQTAAWPRTVAAFLALFLMIIILVIILLLVLPQLITSISNIVSSLPDAAERFRTWLSNLSKGSDSKFIRSISDSVQAGSQKLQEYLRTSMLPALQSAIPDVTSGFMGLVGLVGNFFIGCIVSIYLLCSWERFMTQARLLLYSIVPKKASDWIMKEVRFTDRMFSGFIIGKLLDSFIVGVLCFVVSVICRFPYAALVSVIVGVTNLIPFFGPYIGIVPSVILILTESPLKAVIFLVVVLILEQIDGNVIGPKILGNKLGLNSFWILFSILFFGGLWGLPGMLAGAPIFAVLYDLIRRAVYTGLDRNGQEEMKNSYKEQFSPDEPEDESAREDSDE